jgi:Type I phosphodiesterase / nucleotide pyrophosphatase
MLTNSLTGGLIVAAYLTVLVLHLNPALGLHPTRVIPLFLALAVFYGVHAAAFFYLLIVVRQVLAAEMLSPGWLSVRLLLWLVAGASAVGAALMWMNVSGFQAALDPRVVRRMTTAALALTTCAVVLSLFALLNYSFGRRGGRPMAAGLVAVALASLMVPLVARGPAVEEGPIRGPARAGIGPSAAGAAARVSMLLLDGASLEFIAPAAEEGRLPNFGKLLDNGAVMHLATLRPTQPIPVWTALATGKLPYKNGVRSAATYAFRGGDRRITLLPDYCYAHALVHFGFLAEVPRTSSAVLARPLWDILSGLGISTGIVGWPLTFPATAVRGYLVSEEFYQLPGELPQLVLEGDPAAAYPDDVVPLVLASRAAPLTASPFPPPPAAPASWRTSDGGTNAVANSLAMDMAYERVAADLQAARPAQITAVRLPGLDAVAHHYLRYATPAAFGDVTDEDRQRYGRVLEQYYGHIDAAVGRALAALGPTDLLLVVSGFGMEPLRPVKRLLERVVGDPSRSGTHERAPDGFLMAYGGSVQVGHLSRGSILDVAPTILYFLGLPVARDMDGYARPDLFTPAFTTVRPITFIPSYDR